MPKKAVLFQVNRITDARTETDMVRDAIAAKSGDWALIDILRGDLYRTQGDAEAKLLGELSSGIDMLIAHLSDWEAFWGWYKRQPPATRPQVKTPADCVMFTTQSSQPCKKKNVSPFAEPVHYISKDRLALYIKDILDKGSKAIDERDGTERRIRDLAEALSPYCFLRPEDSLEGLIGNGLIDKQWEVGLSKIREGTGSTLNDLERWYALNPRELILEFRGYL